MQFLPYLKDSAQKIEKELKTYLDLQIEVAKNVSPELEPLVHLFAQSCEGGKRLRGALVMLGYELAGKDYTDEILRASLAFEVFQTAILAHDDVIDLSPLRRGKQTLFKALGGDHYGMSQSICLGDTGFFLAFQLIAKSDFPEDRKLKALVSFNDTMLKTAAGQMLDILIPHRQDGNYSEKEAETVAHLKTAHYTIIGPLHLGAILGGADKKMLEKLEDFGKKLGIAFQIQDDILGVFGTEETIGKSITSDVEEGKNTLLIAYALSHSNPDQKKFLQEKYGKGEISSDDLEKIREIFKKSGALDYSRQIAVEYVNLAKQAIAGITTNKHHDELLSELADFLVSRNK